ncbi:uncharacterized protein LOC143283830 [Babylonia areolata]|uniref:uncharacterized protein LOC143283830 n=1 Tax=Babylonia areolata TaxID=304850 RepID=UPI003FD10E40
MLVQKILQLYIIFATVSRAGCEYISQSYNITPSSFISSYQEVVSVSSAVGCAGECLKRSTCDSAAYKDATRECFLHVQSQDAEHSIQGVTVVTGEPRILTCGEDFLYSGDNPTIICSASGVCSADGTCRQRIWRNPPQTLRRFALPRAVHGNWTMCLRGTSCSSCPRFAFTLVDPQGNYPAYIDARMAHPFQHIVLMTSLWNGAWTNDHFVNERPFNYGQSFSLEFRVVGDRQLQVSVDGSEITVYNTGPTLTAATYLDRLDYNEDTSVHFVDLWSGC